MTDIKGTPPVEKNMEKISTHDFYFETSLYRPIKIEQLEEDILNGKVDGYSSSNHIDTTYSIEGVKGIKTNIQEEYVEKSESKGMHVYKTKITNQFINIDLTCRRTGDDTLTFNLLVLDDSIIKVGQYPSLADIQFAELGRKYDKILPKNDLQDFKKAIGLISHGAGAGAFVYLRRIFERLIIETYETNKSSLGVQEKDFVHKRMDEKVDLLKNLLPDQIIEMKGIYGILSKGVHELSEDQCRQYFNPIKLSIELILDEKIETQMKKERDEKVKKELQKIHKEMSK